MIPAFVINLDRSTDRLAHMQTEFARVGLDFERFAAVKGTDLSPALEPYFCDASGKIVSPLQPGEIGCYASHLGVWQRIVEAGLNAALVCEDDIQLPDDLAALVDPVVRAAPSGWDIVRLIDWDGVGYSRAFVLAPLPGARHLIRYWQLPMGTGAYLVSRQGAAKLLRPGIRRNGVDAEFRRPWRFGLDQYGVHPPPVVHSSNIPSLIGADRGCWDASRTKPRALKKMRKTLLKLRQHAYNIGKMGWRPWVHLVVRRELRRQPGEARRV